MKSWLLVWLGAVLALAGCSDGGGFCRRQGNAQTPVCTMSDAQQAAIPVKGEWWQPSQSVTLTSLGTELQADALRRAAGGHSGMALSGLAIPDRDSGRCDIYVALPTQASTDQLEAIGHELLHCLVGGYHPNMLSGKPESSYLSPAQASLYRDGIKAAIDEAESRSRWTLSCTFGTNRCPAPSPPARLTVSLRVHPVTHEGIERIAAALGQAQPPGGVTLSDGRRCDLYLPLPTTYLGRAHEVLGRQFLACFTADRDVSGLERKRRLVEDAINVPRGGSPR